MEEEEEEHLFVLCALYATRALCARDKTHALYLGKTQVYADIPILYTFPIYIYIYILKAGTGQGIRGHALLERGLPCPG